MVEGNMEDGLPEGTLSPKPTNEGDKVPNPPHFPEPSALFTLL